MEQFVKAEKSKYNVGFHETPLILSWMILANLTIIVGALKWYKPSFYIHAIMGAAIIGLTLAGTLHVLFEVGIYYNPTKRFQLIHNICGLVVVIWLALQAITGVLSRIIQYSAIISPTMCKWTKFVHQFSSYLIMLLAKFQYMIIYYRRGKYGQIILYFIIDVISVWIYVTLKYKYSKLSETILESQLVENAESAQMDGFTKAFGQIRTKINQMRSSYEGNTFQIPEIKKIDVIYHSDKQIPFQNYFLFNDFVYNADALEQFHPGGQKNIQLIKQRQVDRFMYGFYPLQMVESWTAHKHSHDSFRLCGQPSAKIQRSSPMNKFPQLMKVTKQYCQKISNSSSVYLLHLSPKASPSQDWIRLKYGGFTEETQIGQYFTLTICDQKGKNKVTRLYTTIWCMRPDNIEFMQKHFPKSTTNCNMIIANSEETFSEQIPFKKDEVIPLMIKRYLNGEVTSRFLGQNFNGQIILSNPMGSGLKYDELPRAGKVIFICGGTGILPFCDIIDLLFKRVKYLEKSNLSNAISVNDPLVKEDLIKQRQFLFYFACQSFEDVFPLVLYQLNFLSQSPLIKFQSIMRVKSNLGQYESQYPKILFQKQYFTEQIEEHLKIPYQIAKLYICGPHRMNNSIGEALKRNKIAKDLYHFV